MFICYKTVYFYITTLHALLISLLVQTVYVRVVPSYFCYFTTYFMLITRKNNSHQQLKLLSDCVDKRMYCLTCGSYSRLSRETHKASGILHVDLSACICICFLCMCIGVIYVYCIVYTALLA